MTHSSLLSRSACLNEHWSIGPGTEITAGHDRPIEQLPQVSLKQAAFERIPNQSFPMRLDEPIQHLDRRGVRRLGQQVLSALPVQDVQLVQPVDSCAPPGPLERRAPSSADSRDSSPLRRKSIVKSNSDTYQTALSHSGAARVRNASARCKTPRTPTICRREPR